MPITIEEVVNMALQLTIRASQAEARVKQLEEEVKELELPKPGVKEEK